MDELKLLLLEMEDMLTWAQGDAEYACRQRGAEDAQTEYGVTLGIERAIALVKEHIRQMEALPERILGLHTGDIEVRGDFDNPLD